MKPLDKLLEEAACQYYEVGVEFFKLKKKDGNTDKRRVLFWLLNNDANMQFASIAARYEYRQVSISEGIKLLEFRRTTITTIARDIENIRKLALDK